MIIIEYIKDNKPRVYTDYADILDAWSLACILARFAIDNRDCRILKIYEEKEGIQNTKNDIT